MRHAYRSGAVTTEPPETGASSAGFPQDDTVPGARWAHSITSEIVNAIMGGGLTPDGADLTQLRQSIAAQITTAVSNVVIPPGVTLATISEHTRTTPPPPNDEAATPAGLRAMLDALFPRTDGRAEFTTAGQHSYDWEWSVTKGIAIIEGAGGGGGGGSRSGATSAGGGGGGGSGNAIGGRATGSATSGAAGTLTQGGAGGAGQSTALAGSGGDGGSASIVTVGGDTYYGHGGGGGGGPSSGDNPTAGGGGGHTVGTGTNVGQSTFAPSSSALGGHGGGGPAGGAGGAGEAGGINGAGGGGGLVTVVVLTGLSQNDTFSITVGAGGAGGAGAALGAGRADDGAAGSDGRVILIPLF